MNMETYAHLPRLVCSWYAENKRQLPWRRDRDPYRVWVSEIMLQQTRVEAAKPYFERFITELPDAAALADCPEDKLLKLWEGLGYYSRVRNMQKAARIIVRDRKGKLPADPKELTALPGIGSYTAGAIASIAYGFRVPAVDGNVLRILAEDLDFAASWIKQPKDHLDRRGLARAVRPKEAKDLARLDGKVDAVDGLRLRAPPEVHEDLRQTYGFDHDFFVFLCNHIGN